PPAQVAGAGRLVTLALRPTGVWGGNFGILGGTLGDFGWNHCDFGLFPLIFGVSSWELGGILGFLGGIIQILGFSLGFCGILGEILRIFGFFSRDFGWNLVGFWAFPLDFGWNFWDFGFFGWNNSDFGAFPLDFGWNLWDFGWIFLILGGIFSILGGIVSISGGIFTFSPGIFAISPGISGFSPGNPVFCKFWASPLPRWRGAGGLVTLALRPTGIFGERHPLLELFYRRGRGLGGARAPHLPPNAEHGRVYAGNVAWMHVLAAPRRRARPASVGGQFFFCYDASPWAPYEEFNLLLLGPAGISGGPPRPPAALGAPGLAQRPPEGNFGALRGVLGEKRILGRFGVCWAPLLNPYTWAVASTPFSVRTDKAERQLGYRPLFSWEEARDRTARWVRQLGGA
ncbi:LOW QUALITY PROTEIN: uncharacterized protein LOC135292221, partial [Passer domesticus]|uniref:LOW QUALITY PROTEIN: uncharacterized protein LOC135292221 n=1 Tax=Passer domesticus TaxID=48849 RepID=UPI0030FE5E7A